MPDTTAPTDAKKWWRPTWRTLALWFALWLPWLYVGVLADSSNFSTGESSLEMHWFGFGWPWEYFYYFRDYSEEKSSGDIDFSYLLLGANLLVSVAIASICTFVAHKWLAKPQRQDRVTTGRPGWPTLALWLLLSIPWLYLGLLADTSEYDSIVTPNGIQSLQPIWRLIGWPYEYLWISWDYSEAVPYAQIDFSKSLFCIDLFASLAIGSVFFFAAQKWLATIRKNGFRFRLTTLLALVVIVSIPLALWKHIDDGYRREEPIRAELRKLHIYTVGAVPLILNRLDRFIPERTRIMWQRAEFVSMSGSADREDPDRIFELIKQLKYVNSLNIAYVDNPNKMLEIVPQLPGVRTVYLDCYDVTEEGLQHLMKCPWLEEIQIDRQPDPVDAIKRLRKALPHTKVICEFENDE